MSDRTALGRIGHDFSIAALGEVAHVEMGQSPDSRYVFEDPFLGYPFLQGNSEFGMVSPEPKYGCTRPTKLARVDDVLISVRAPVGAINVADRNYCIGRGLAAIRMNGVNASLAAHVIARQSNALRRLAQGTTFEAINKNDLLTLQLLIPPKDELSIIAQILDTLDTAIRETEAIIAKLKAVKQGMLHDLLTRGLDANGELRPPQAEAPHLYKESPLGWIPREWRMRRIHEVGESVTGSTPPSHDPLAWGAGLPFITPGDIKDDKPTAEVERQVSSRGMRYVRLLPPRSTLVVCIGSTIGKIGITSTEACTNQQINAVIPSTETCPEFLFFAIQKHIGQLRSLAGLQAVPIVNKSSFESIYIPDPPYLEQIAIASHVTAMSTRLDEETRQIDKLCQEKSGLMDDLLTGRVRVTPLLEGTPP